MNVYIEIRAGGSYTSQCSPYQIKHSSIGAIGTYDYDHGHHPGATEDADIGANKPNKSEEKLLLFELQY